MNANGHQTAELLPNGHKPWYRWPGESTKAYQAFSRYLSLGPERSSQKVAQECTKNHSLLRRWSARWCWVERAKAYDDYQAREIEQRTMLARMQLDEKSLQVAADAIDLPKMTADQKQNLSVMERAALLRVASGMCGARDEDLPPRGFAPDLQPPRFEIRIIRPGHDMIGVQLPDGRAGYVPADQVERFRREMPDAVVLL